MLVALALNVEFQRYGKMGPTNVMDTVVMGGRYAGWRVDELADTAHLVLSGEASKDDPRFDPANLARALTRVNAAGTNCREQVFLGLAQ